MPRPRRWSSPRLFTEIFPDRHEIPKTLVFAKSDDHAEDILRILRDTWALSNAQAVKITYRAERDPDPGAPPPVLAATRAASHRPEQLISAFRNSYHPRVAVTVDMIATGTDIKPLECVVFMRSYAQGVKANVLFFDRRPGSPNPWTERLWVYDLRTNARFTLKANPMRRADLSDFEALYRPGARHERAATWSEATPDGRWRSYAYAELVSRDKCSLDLFWLKDESLLDADSLPEPDVIAAEIAEDLRGALEQLEAILVDLGGPA